MKKVKVNSERNFVAKYSAMVNTHKVERDRTKYSRNEKHKQNKLDKLYSLQYILFSREGILSISQYFIIVKVFMYYLLEVTDWDMPNHTYVFANKKSIKVIGYIPQGTNEVQMFKKPYNFDKKYRKFKEVIVS